MDRNGATGAQQVRLAYLDTGAQNKPVLIAIHGSPGSGEALEKLANLLSPDYRVIVPDLPGFGDSTRDIPDYSFRAHARYVLELMDKLGVAKAHLLGFSMGGGVVLSLADIAPDRVQSLTMLSAIGTQENELTGSYAVNHCIHGVQLVGLYLLRYAVPHFGLADRMMLSTEYARNFYDSDQRPLRAVLQKYSGPMLIIHGSNDFLVPVAAAREHHRLVSQSKLMEISGESHFMAFMNPERFADELKSFLATAEGQDPHSD
jgi:pimeloyl-ACP methyl ester carboxylesterase